MPKDYHSVYRYHDLRYTPPKRERVVRYSSPLSEKSNIRRNSQIGNNKTYLPVVHKGSLPVPIEHYQLDIFSFNNTECTPIELTVNNADKEKRERKKKREEFIRTADDIVEFIEQLEDYGSGGDGLTDIIQWASDSTKNDSTKNDYPVIYFF